MTLKEGVVMDAVLQAKSRTPERRKSKAARSTARNFDIPCSVFIDDTSLYGQRTDTAFGDSVETVATSPKDGQLKQATLVSAHNKFGGRISL